MIPTFKTKKRIHVNKKKMVFYGVHLQVIVLVGKIMLLLNLRYLIFLQFYYKSIKTYFLVDVNNTNQESNLNPIAESILVLSGKL